MTHETVILLIFSQNQIKSHNLFLMFGFNHVDLSSSKHVICHEVLKQNINKMLLQLSGNEQLKRIIIEVIINVILVGMSMSQVNK